MIRADPWQADQDDLAVKISAVLDQATVELLTLTSSPEARIRALADERCGTDPYDHAPPVRPCDRLLCCPVCGRRFWAEGEHGLTRIYCTPSCQRRSPAKVAANVTYYRVHRADPAWRAKQNARARLRYRGRFARTSASA